MSKDSPSTAKIVVEVVNPPDCAYDLSKYPTLVYAPSQLGEGVRIVRTGQKIDDFRDGKVSDRLTQREWQDIVQYFGDHP